MALPALVIGRVGAVDQDGARPELTEHRVRVLLGTDVEEMDPGRHDGLLPWSGGG
jgi:hypothetical protein